MKPGDITDNSALRKDFAVGNMGGIRRSRQNNLLVIVSDHTKALYDDHWEGQRSPLHRHGSQGTTKSSVFTNNVPLPNRTPTVSPYTCSKSSNPGDTFTLERWSSQKNRIKKIRPTMKVSYARYGCSPFD